MNNPNACDFITYEMPTPTVEHIALTTFAVSGGAGSLGWLGHLEVLRGHLSGVSLDGKVSARRFSRTKTPGHKKSVSNIWRGIAGDFRDKCQVREKLRKSALTGIELWN